MKNLDNKIELGIGVMAVALVMGLGYFINGVKHKSPSEILDMVYNMPRPKHYSAAGFDLSGREVDRRYVNPFEKKEKDAKKDQNGLKQVAQPLIPQGPQQAQAKKAKSKQAQKKNKVSVEVVGNDSDKISNTEELQASGGNQPQNYVNTVADVVAQNPEAEAPQDKEILTASQWRSLLSAQPTSKNLNALVAAFNKKEIDEQAYFVIIEDLLKNSKAEVQILGVYGANAVPTARAFALLATEEPNLDSKVAESANKVMNGFVKNARQNAMIRVMQGSNTVAVVKAIEVVMDGYENIKQDSGDDRGDRGDASEQALASFVKFVPVLRALQSSADGHVSSAANQALGLINVAAVN